MDDSTQRENRNADDTVPAAVDAPTAANAQVTVPVEGRADPVTVPVAFGMPGPAPDVRFVTGAAPVPATAPASRRGWMSPTVTDLREPSVVDPAYAHPGYDLGPAQRPRRRRWWIAVVAVLVIAAGTVAFTLVGSHQSAPVRSVRSYFDALAAGDTTGALALVDNASKYTPTADPLLSPGALARVSDRPAHLTVLGTAATTIGGGQSATAVSVTYSVADTTVHQTITVAGDGSTLPYLLEVPFITVAMPTGGHSVTVNGIAISDGTTHTPAFPGAYVAAEAGTQLLAAATAPAVYTSAAGNVEADFSLPARTVAPGAAAAVQAAVNHALDKCAASTSATPSGCPFSYGDSSASVKWSVLTYPQIQVLISGKAVSFDDSGHPGTMHYDATTSVFFGLIPQTDSGSATAHVTGTATVAGGNVVVTFAH